ncbi:MAG: hypothetical protein M1368_06230 [Thaumarchaeota archaeon]|nr:hypothetical protein [Nitrososphaerota archaeon]
MLTISVQGSTIHDVVELLSLGVGLFALGLLAATLAAYRKTGQRGLLLVSAAFGLFAAKILVRHLDILIFNWGYATTDFLYNLADFAVVILLL